MKLIKKILFPTDFGESMEPALDTAISIATKFNSELILLHVLPEDSENNRLKEMVKEKMEEFMAKLKAANIKCSYDLIAGNSADVIINTADKKKANLIILGAGKSRMLEFKLGSNSEKIIRNSQMPVWVIEKDKSLTINSILCPVDFSAESRIALDNAIHICRSYDAEITILHVEKSLNEEYPYLGIDLTFEEPEKLKTTSIELEEFLKDINLEGVNYKKEVKLGNPEEAIINAITNNNADLVVMGTKGKSGLERFLIGSVTESISRKVPCSFIISKSEKLIQLQLSQGLSDIDAIFEEGVKLLKNGFHDEAISTWKKCTAMNELYLKAWSAIATTYDKLGENKEAKKYSDIRNQIQQSIWDKHIEADLRSKHGLFK